jgi:riboflavin kinase / FMN adenylyltransferase
MTAVDDAPSLHGVPPVGPAALCMGVFDGVHRGHQALLAATRRAAEERGIASVALLFEPPPLEVIRPGQRVPRLAPVAENLRRLREAGIDVATALAFTARLRDMAPEAFLAVLAPAIDLRALVMTPESAFGRARAGTPDAMRIHGAAAGFDVIVLEPLAGDARGPTSSTRVRELLAAGEIAAATAHLGRPPYLAGTVVHGDARGRELGYPTANLAFDYLPALPALGIYAGRATAQGTRAGHPALVSVGVRPTFKDHAPVLVEAHLLDFDGDLYDRPLGLELTARIRDEARFASVEALVTQMREDERQARAILL